MNSTDAIDALGRIWAETHRLDAVPALQEIRALAAPFVKEPEPPPPTPAELRQHAAALAPIAATFRERAEALKAFVMTDGDAKRAREFNDAAEGVERTRALALSLAEWAERGQTP